MSESRKPIRVLVIDDDDTFRRVMSGELARRGYVVSAAADGLHGVELALTTDVDVVLLDLGLPDISGIEVLEKLRAREMPREVVVLTGHGTIDTAIQAVRLGAYDYLEKPCPLDQVEIAIQKSHEHLNLLERQRVLEDGFSPPDVQSHLVGASPAFERIRGTIARVAATDSTVLILGETGVGKEMVATMVHAGSPRREKPFVVVDCTTLHGELLQSELFGHEKGAFTGAHRQKHGLFEVANGGALFLDEIGDTAPDIQSKLLRVLETGRFRRLGGTREIAVDVRLISATNRNLKDAIARGHFREDIFFRLATLVLEIPPLRERAEDIPVLVEHFRRRLDARFSRSHQFTPEAIAALARYPWPGNVRELAHVVEQALVLAPRDIIEREDLPQAVRSSSAAPAAAPDELLTLREVERRHVLAVIEKTGGNRAQASRILGISQRNLYRLLIRYGWSARSPASLQDKMSRF